MSQARDRVRALAERYAVAEVRAELDRPLRVAVAGRLNSGKSTLVNALLGRRIAPVGPVECTTVPTRFVDGPAETVEVAARDGRRWALSLDRAGRLPRDLRAPATEIARLDVTLSHERLRGIELVDTPGLDSLTATTSAATEALLGLDGSSRAAVRHADVLVFLLPRLTPADEERLRAMAAVVTREAGLSVATVVCVLAKADLDGGSVELAARYRERLRGITVDVVPVAGLLAETVLTGAFTERLVADLRALAAVPAEERELLLAAADLFRTEPAPLSTEDRERLVELLDLTGVALCVRLIEEGLTDATALADELLRRSGVPRLEAEIGRLLGRQAPDLVAHTALDALERASFHLPRGGSLRDEVEDLRADPALRRLRELDVLARWSRGELEVGAALQQDLQRLASGAPLADTARAALDGASRWLAVDNGGGRDRATVRAAEVMRESYTRLWQQVRA